MAMAQEKKQNIGKVIWDNVANGLLAGGLGLIGVASGPAAIVFACGAFVVNFIMHRGSWRAIIFGKKEDGTKEKLGELKGEEAEKLKERLEAEKAAQDKTEKALADARKYAEKKDSTSTDAALKRANFHSYNTKLENIPGFKKLLDDNNCSDKSGVLSWKSAQNVKGFDEFSKANGGISLEDLKDKIKQDAVKERTKNVDLNVFLKNNNVNNNALNNNNQSGNRNDKKEKLDIGEIRKAFTMKGAESNKKCGVIDSGDLFNRVYNKFHSQK